MTRISPARFNMQQRIKEGQRDARRAAAQMQPTIDILEAHEAAGTLTHEHRFLLATYRRRIATGWTQPTGAEIMARVAQIRNARGLDPGTGLPQPAKPKGYCPCAQCDGKH